MICTEKYNYILIELINDIKCNILKLMARVHKKLPITYNYIVLILSPIC